MNVGWVVPVKDERKSIGGHYGDDRQSSARIRLGWDKAGFDAFFLQISNDKPANFIVANGGQDGGTQTQSPATNGDVRRAAADARIE